MPATDTHKQAISLLNALPSSKLSPVIELLEQLNHSTQKRTSPQESALIKIIQRKLPSQDVARFNILRQKLEAGSITEAERQALRQLTHRIELQDAERAEAFLRLAQLRQVDIQMVIQEFSSTAA